MSEIEIKEREIHIYSSHQKDLMRTEKDIILSEIKLLELKKISKIYPNQNLTASKIVCKLLNRAVINIMVVAKTQSGKTGTMSALIRNYLNHPSNLIPIENIYIITGLSSRDWIKQTKNRMPKTIEKRVFHRNKLKSSFVKDIKNKKNVLVIMDEIQIAAKKNQTIYNTFKLAGFYNKTNLLKNDVKIIEFTATPDGTIYDQMKWNKNSCKIFMNPGKDYISSYNLLEKEKVKQYKELCGYNKKTDKIDENIYINIEEIKKDIIKYREPRYHIIRTPNGYLQDIVIRNFKVIFNIDSYEFKTYDSNSDIGDINTNLLDNKPKKHTFIFLKEKLRCAKTLTKKYIGIMYERYTNSVANDSVIIQGLVGRLTGYDYNGDSICYTNIESIIKYEKLWKTKFSKKTDIIWNSSTTKYNKNKKELLSNKTFNNPDYIYGMGLSCEKEDRIKEPKKFKTYEKAKQFAKTLPNVKRGPAKLKVKKKKNGKGFNEDGFYEATIKKITKVWSTAELEKGVYKGTANNNYWFYPCYRDIKDKTTLEYWVIPN